MRRHALVVGSLLTLAACSSPAVTEEPIGRTSSAITVSDALARAEEWVTAKVPYCQSANHQPDGDKACSPVCTRPDNPAWDDYRSDCSGFVSWAWGLPAPGRVTWELAPAQTDITFTIQAQDLQPGDAINKPHDHTMLFKAWTVPGKHAVFLEEPGCSASQPYAREVDSDVTISGTSITVASNGITFDAIRYKSLDPTPDAGSPEASAPPEAGAPPEAAAPEASAADASSPPPGADPGTPPSSGGSTSSGFGAPHQGSGCSSSPASPASSGAAVLLALLALRRRRADSRTMSVRDRTDHP
jgi:MYXO-CTERM domain-containing protein